MTAGPCSAGSPSPSHYGAGSSATRGQSRLLIHGCGDRTPCSQDGIRRTGQRVRGPGGGADRVPLYSNAAGILPLVESLYDNGLPMGTRLAFTPPSSSTRSSCSPPGRDHGGGPRAAGLLGDAMTTRADVAPAQAVRRRTTGVHGSRSSPSAPPSGTTARGPLRALRRRGCPGSTTTSSRPVRRTGRWDARDCCANARWRVGWGSCRSSRRDRMTCTFVDAPTDRRSGDSPRSRSPRASPLVPGSGVDRVRPCSSPSPG